MDYTIGPFEFGGKELTVVVSELPQTVEADLENALGTTLMPGGRGASGTAKLMVIRYGVKSIVIEGKMRPLIKRLPNGEEEIDIPNLRDRKTRKSLLDKLVHLVVEKNDWLCYVEPFSEVFSSYAPEEAGDEPENPTPSPKMNVHQPEEVSPEASSTSVSTYSTSIQQS